MNAANDSTRAADELAARWTDSALEILAFSGIRHVSVPMELETWHTLKEVMQLVVRRQQSLPFAPMDVDVFMKKVLFAAILQVARKFAHEFDTFALEYRLRFWIRSRKLPPAEHRIYLQMVHSAVMDRKCLPSSRLGRFPLLSAVGG